MTAIDKPETRQPLPAAGLMAPLHEFEAAHPFWRNELFAACRAGQLSRDDFQFVFGQYYLYSKNFTRYLSGVMANLEDDGLRAKLAQNLWEEAGERDIDQRHAEIFRRFLVDGLGIDLAGLQFLPATQHFVQCFLEHTRNGSALHASAFLSLGTESIVARMYEIFVLGLQRAGIAEEHLRFFRIHMECDDAHAATLAEIVASFADRPGFEAEAKAAVDTALRLRGEFFDGLWRELRFRRIQGHLDRIQGKRSLLSPTLLDAALKFVPSQSSGQQLYANRVEALGIDFSVERAPFPAEVLDARVVRIPPGKANERHKHAHETVFYFLAGSGRVLLDDRWIPVQPGDCVFVPRWAVHQSQNQGTEPMVILAITDHHLTGKAFLGDYDATARMKRG